MSAPLKREDLISQFNGIDIKQTKDYIKVHCETYISKILQQKRFNLTTTSNKPTPISSDADIIKMLDTSMGPTNDAECMELEGRMGFKYTATTGE